ncbi:hypothetical protein TNCV_2264101 [Trichonephila clavipes]|nr:hypothetical protein TNCV_2264101 [Trichonephila clavipes]
MVERFNRTILNNLLTDGLKNQQDWDQKVPLFLLAYRSAVHETIGYSPSQMLLAGIFVSLVTCCLVALRIHLHRLRVRAESQARFEDVHHLARERDQPEDGEDEDSVRHKSHRTSIQAR